MNDTAFGVNGSTIKLFSGNYYNLASPRACDVRIVDIAHALANICRFGGHIPRFYSVAEHLIQCYRKAVAEMLPAKVQFACLMHDSPEAYIGDVVKPLKVLLEPIYGPIEQANEDAIAEAYAIDFQGTKSEWKRIDREMLIAERNAIFGVNGDRWAGEELVSAYHLTPNFYPPYNAKAEFLRCFGVVQLAIHRGE